jgi:hypothetical protein
MTAPPPKLWKKDRNRSHAKARAKERFGIDLTNEDLRRIVRDIESGVAIFILPARGSRDVGLYDVILRSRLVRIVYDRVTKVVVTVLPSTALWPAPKRAADAGGNDG